MLKDDKKMISARILESDRLAVQTLANRLYVRESDIYRFAINHLFSRFNYLLDITMAGSDLLFGLVEVRNELHHTLGLKKDQLYRIINSVNCTPEKQVAMYDIELLLMPQHILKQHLHKLFQTPKDPLNVEEWLMDYYADKYNLNRR